MTDGLKDRRQPPAEVKPAGRLAEMTTAEFLEHLKLLDVDVRAKDSKLLLTAPAGSLSTEIQQELRRRKPEILAFLLNATELAKQEYLAPLTYAQQRLWLVDKAAPQSSVYNIPQSLILPGDVVDEALRRAIHRLAERHEALRTRIEVRNGEPAQVISRHLEIPLETTDLSSLDAESQQMQLLALLVEESGLPFALNQAPLVRFHAIRLGPGRQLIFYNIHHIVADQWSLGILRRDLSALYTEAVSGQPADLPPLPLQYSDVAAAERSKAVTDLHSRQIEYWRERLQDMPTLLELPFAKSRPPQQSFSGATFSFQLEAEITKQLRELAIRTGTSLYLLLFTIFASLLYRYTGQKDFCLGTPLTGRKRRDEEDVVGLFLNMLPLRCILDPKEPFDRLLRRVKNAVLTDFEHGDVPFQRLLMELQPKRSAAYSPFFQMTFALNHGGADIADEQRGVFIGTAKFDLALEIAEREDTMNAHLEYRTDLFTQSDIEGFGEHFVQWIESVVSAPEGEVGALPILTRKDREAFRRWNSTELDFDRKATLSSLVERSMKDHPEAVALCCGETTLSYRELKDRVDRLAASLYARGVESRSVVGICLHRSPDVVVAILAILQAGAAYLPLDPRYPVDRLAYMLEDSAARLVIAHRNDASATLSRDNPRLEFLFVEDEAWPSEQPKGQGSTVSLHPPQPSDPAYLIYTSGSTGKPKGVVVEHRNVVALLAWAKDFFDPEALRGILASTSVSFDISVFEIFLPLITGNTIVLVNDILELRGAPHADRVTLVNTVPSAMKALLAGGLPPTVRTVCMGGEFLPASLVDSVYAAQVAEVFDLYGPTETTVYSCCARRAPNARPSIGTPIGNTRIYVLDESLRQVPPGVVGELFIGGAGVSRGYLGKPELNAERFFVLPEIEPDGEIYRTGDYARQLDDGSLVYLGRRDQQIKLRGHRIELGEIETALRQVAGSPTVAVILQKLEAGEALIAFVEGEPGSLDIKACAAGLRERLPAYMVPNRIIVSPALPLTANGKVDRKMLVHLIEAKTLEFEPPQDLLEQWLANIWAVKLGKNEVARNDNFFDDLGGHSLTAFEIFVEIEMRLGIEMGLAILFSAPTVELLADAIRLRPWKRPRHFSFVAPGSSNSVCYLFGQSAAEWKDKLGFDGHRSMLIELPARSSDGDSEDLALEIDRFEAARPPLVLVAEDAIRETIQNLVGKLTQIGFATVSVQLLEPAVE